MLGEEFGASLWDFDRRGGTPAFRDFSANPAGRLVLDLAPGLFPLIHQFLTTKGR